LRSQGSKGHASNPEALRRFVRFRAGLSALKQSQKAAERAEYVFTFKLLLSGTAFAQPYVQGEMPSAALLQSYRRAAARRRARSE